MSGSQNGQERCVYSHNISEKPGDERHPSFATPKSWLLQTLTHLPHPPFLLYYTPVPRSNERISLAARRAWCGGQLKKKKKSWH